MTTEEVPEHLGGHLYKTHVDKGAFDFMNQRYTVRSFLDVGCGPGGMVNLALQERMNAIGVDGDPTLLKFKTPMFLHDFTKGPTSYFTDRVYDLGWSVEFVEHVEEQYLDNFMQLFQDHCKIVVMTHALPGAPGVHHVNCQTEDYWIQKFAERGLVYSEADTKIIRSRSTMVKDFMRNTGKVFFNTKYKKQEDK